MKKALFCVVIVAATVSLICAEGISFKKLCSGERAVYGVEKKLEAPGIAIARNEGELKRIWAEDVTGSYSDMKGLPAVNWKGEFVLAVFIGPRPTSGYSVFITEVKREDKTVVAKIKERKPPPGSMTAQVVTSPYALVACSNAEINLKEIILLKLINQDGKTLVEHPAWSYRQKAIK